MILRTSSFVRSFIGPIVAASAALAACGDDNAKGSTADADAAGETTPDTTHDATGEASETAPETVTPGKPEANVYPISPAVTPETEVVELKHLTDTSGKLIGEYANVRNCLPDKEKGTATPLDLGGFQLTITTCFPDYTALAGPAGDWLAITPPATPEADDGTFAEVQMYHHMQVVHDYFKDNFGLTDRDAPLDSLVNVQAHVDFCDEWAKLPNAAFFPHESLEQLPIDLDLAGDAIVFSGTATKNFAFDAMVIYHEYTHAMVGATRLSAVFADDQGLNNLPGALNEAYADYFAATITGEPVMGEYSLNDLGSFAICGFPLGGDGGNQSRDLTTVHSCPGDLTAEVHADSEIFSGALWEIHEELGAADADTIILSAVLGLVQTSDFEAAADATIDEATEVLGADAAAKVRAAFEKRGLIGCERVLPIANAGQRGLPVTLEGAGALQPNPYPGYTPGYLQYAVDVPEGKTSVALTLDLQAGGFGGGTATPNLELAFKQGPDAVRYSVGIVAGSATNDSEVGVPVGATKKAAISGACLAGKRLVFAVHNKGDGLSLGKITATFGTDTTDVVYPCPD